MAKQRPPALVINHVVSRAPVARSTIFHASRCRASERAPPAAAACLFVQDFIRQAAHSAQCRIDLATRGHTHTHFFLFVLPHQHRALKDHWICFSLPRVSGSRKIMVPRHTPRLSPSAPPISRKRSRLVSSLFPRFYLPLFVVRHSPFLLLFLIVCCVFCLMLFNKVFTCSINKCLQLHFSCCQVDMTDYTKRVHFKPSGQSSLNVSFSVR